MPRREAPHGEPMARPHPPKAAARPQTPFEQFLCSPGGRWINGLAWSALAMLLAFGLTFAFGARAYYSLIHKCFVFPALSAIGAGLFYMFNLDEGRVVRRNVITAIETGALIVVLQGVVRLIWI